VASFRSSSDVSDYLNRVAGLSHIQLSGMPFAPKEVRVLQQLNSVEERSEYATPSYLYPHAWPPGTEILRWVPEEATPLLVVSARGTRGSPG
jgi:hypothetical protein